MCLLLRAGGRPPPRSLLPQHRASFRGLSPAPCRRGAGDLTSTPSSQTAGRQRRATRRTRGTQRGTRRGRESGIGGPAGPEHRHRRVRFHRVSASLRGGLAFSCVCKYAGSQRLLCPGPPAALCRQARLSRTARAERWPSPAPRPGWRSRLHSAARPSGQAALMSLVSPCACDTMHPGHGASCPRFPCSPLPPTPTRLPHGRRFCCRSGKKIT